MKSRWGIAVLIACAAAIVIGLVWPREREPAYQGKKLSEWLKAYQASLSSGDYGASQYREAADAIRQIGTNGLPYFLTTLGYERSGLKEKQIRAMNAVADWRPTRGLGYFFLHRLYAGDRRANLAIDGFHILGPAAAPAVPELLPLLEHTNHEIRRRGVAALEAIGDDGIPALLAVLRDEQRPHRRGAAFGMMSLCMNPIIRTNATSAVPVLIGCLKDKDIGIVSAAATALAFLKIQPDVCVPALLELMQDTNSIARPLAAFSLGEFEEQARPALPVLLKALNDSDAGVRVAATGAVKKIAPEALPKEDGKEQ